MRMILERSALSVRCQLSTGVVASPADPVESRQLLLRLPPLADGHRHLHGCPTAQDGQGHLVAHTVGGEQRQQIFGRSYRLAVECDHDVANQQARCVGGGILGDADDEETGAVRLDTLTVGR